MAGAATSMLAEQRAEMTVLFLLDGVGDGHLET